MKSALRILSVAAFALVATSAFAQAQGGAQNPLTRSQQNSFYFGALNGPRTAPAGAPGLAQGNPIQRPNARFGPVTPVPEPSQWAMMLAGIAFVGWIVRPRSNRQ